ncbi:MAG: dihydrolipoyl dehydrogenase [Clostridia bacterium]|nr:dihydrolipoyl dehydrogenase [Clostridia bacterium]
MELYDLIVLGGGPAGYNAAERAAEEGLKTLLFEGRALGGVCLNEGCIPTKTLLYSAKIYDYAKHGPEYGVSFDGAKIDHKAVVERKGRVVKMLVGGIGATLKKAGVTVVSENAKITGRDGEGFTVAAAGTEYKAKKLLVCTGSTAAVPPIPGLRESVASGFAKTNREILEMTTVPKKLVVIGGGVIGLEMASYFNSIGSKVTVIEMLDHIAGPTDREISSILQKNYMKRGVEFLLQAKVTSVEKDGVCFEKDGKAQKAEADCVLVSIGRRAMTADIGLETIGVKVERGAIVTNERCETNIAGVWAAGDVNGKLMLAHTAYREGEVAVNNMVGKRDEVHYESIPSVIYTNPEVASVGETSESVKEKGLDAKTLSVTLKYSGRYVAENEGGDGIVKLIIDKEHRYLIGVHMIGNYASEIIYGAAMMVEKKMRVDNIKKFVFPHPSVCEVIREGIFQI